MPVHQGLQTFIFVQQRFADFFKSDDERTVPVAHGQGGSEMGGRLENRQADLCPGRPCSRLLQQVAAYFSGIFLRYPSRKRGLPGRFNARRLIRLGIRAHGFCCFFSMAFCNLDPRLPKPADPLDRLSVRYCWISVWVCSAFGSITSSTSRRDSRSASMILQ